MSENGLNQAVIARSLGVSSSLISQWLKGSYKGDVATFETKLKSFMGNYSKRDLKEVESVVMTNDLRMTHFIIDEAIIGREMCLIYGEAGSGKTTAVKEYVKKHPEAVLIEVIPGMSLKSFLKKLCFELGVNGANSNEEMIYAISEELKRREALIIIDEAENLTTKALEAIRRVWDFSKTPIALVGTYSVIRNLKGRSGELLQLYTRISGKWEFRGLNDKEFEELFGDISKDIAKYTRHFRRAMNIYKKAIRLASMQNKNVNAGFVKAASEMVILD